MPYGSTVALNRKLLGLTCKTKILLEEKAINTLCRYGLFSHPCKNKINKNIQQRAIRLWSPTRLLNGQYQAYRQKIGRGS